MTKNRLHLQLMHASHLYQTLNYSVQAQAQNLHAGCLPNLNQNHGLQVATSTESEVATPLSDFEEVKFEERNFVAGISCLTKEGKFKWTPVKRRIRKKDRETAGSQDVSISSDSGSELDLSCSRLIEYENRDGVHGLAIHRRGPAQWTPIKPIASRTRSKLEGSKPI